MANYIVPQVLINQLISEVSLNTIKNQNVLVIGPNYQLFRFSNTDEKQKIDLGRYDAAHTLAEGEYVKIVNSVGAGIDTFPMYLGSKTYHVVEYPNLPANSTPDSSYTRVFADSVYIKLCSISQAADFDDSDETAETQFEVSETEPGTGAFTTITFAMQVAGGKKARAPMFERDINPGDSVYLKYVKDGKTEVYKAKIVSVPEDLDGKFYSVVVDESFPVSDLEYVDHVPWSYDESNEEAFPESYTFSSAKADLTFCALVDDVEIKSKTKTRNVYNWVARENTEYTEEFGIDFAVSKSSGVWVDYSNWYTAAELAEGKDAMGGEIQHEGQLEVLSAEIYVQYRALLRNTATDIVSIESNTLVEPTLGTVDPDNPLAFGVHMATLNCGNRLVYYCGIATDDLAGYNAVLGKASLTDEVYIICPTTMDKEVIQSVKAHVLSMSTAENKLWRIGFVAMKAPTEDMIYDKTDNPSGEDFVAVFSEPKRNPAAPYDENTKDFRIMTFWEGVGVGGDTTEGRASTITKCNTQVEPGDKVKVFTENVEDTWDDTYKYTVYTVYKVLSNNSLLLTDPLDVYADDDDYHRTSANIGDYKPAGHLDGLTDRPLKVELYRVLTFDRQVKYIADQSSQLATRRMYNVFPTIASNAGVSFGGEFLACAAAGLVSSVLPQQPVTNVELNGIDDIPIVYQTYTRAQLNTIAAGGTFIIMQDRPNSKVYVRHQISTDYTSNNLLKAELSITKNLDSISYYFAEIFAPLIGKYNITPELIEVIRSKLYTGLMQLETATAAGLYGPQVLADGTEVLELYQNPVNKDHVYAKVHLNLPVPFNYFDLDLEI